MLKNNSSGKVLLVDDEKNIIEAISRYLEKEDIEVFKAFDGKEALEKARTKNPDLIVLDLMLPEIDGLEVCRTLRNESSVYIIMLTAKTEELDKMVGYAMGADSYVTKPFSPKVLVAKIKAALKRIKSDNKNLNLKQERIKIKDLVINNNQKLVKKEDKAIELTGKEFDILWLLASNPDHVFSRYEILEEVWGEEAISDSDTVTVHIRRLREKIEVDPSEPDYIKTVWGVGYKFASN